MSMKNALECYRILHDMTFRTLAARSGISVFAVFSHCKGNKKLTAESALKYNRALGIPLSDLRPDLWPPETGAGAKA